MKVYTEDELLEAKRRNLIYQVCRSMYKCELSIVETAGKVTHVYQLLVATLHETATISGNYYAISHYCVFSDYCLNPYV